MNIVEQLRRHQCPENKGCNPVVDYCQCALMDSGADEIERLRGELKDKDELIQYLEGHIEGLKKFVVQQKESE